MTDKLKTLKDMVYGRVPKEIHNELRAEAILQVKGIDQIANGVGFYFIGAVYFKLTPELIMVREYIKWQNNLTEEDLE